MKAFVLAAGIGSRLRPLTDSMPKCLVPIGGRPLLAYWYDLFEHHGIDEVLVNTHHLPDQVERFVKEHATRVKTRLVHEPTLLGSAGTLAANRDFVRGERDFFVLYADNLTDVDLTKLLRAHEASRQPLTIGLFRASEPRNCGIVTLDGDGLVTSFEEKPQTPRSDLAFAGVAVATPALLDLIPAQAPVDLGKDVLPRMVGRMTGVPIDGHLRDVGTPAAYAQAQIDVRTLRTVIR